MSVKIFTAKLLIIVLGFAYLIGLFPTSNQMLSMQTMRMDATTTFQIAASQSNLVQGNTGGNSTGSCCDAMGSVSPACDFLVSQSACVPVHGGSERVVNSAPVIHSIHIKSVTPPPKA